MSLPADNSGNFGSVLLTNVLSRQRLSLDGLWKTIVDPYEMGYRDLFGNRNERGYFRDFKPRHKGDRVEYSFDDAPELLVPGDWNTQRSELLYYEGTVWYRRLVDLDDDLGADRLFINIAAANHTSRVFWDGRELATHHGGFGPFAAEVTEWASRGQHSLVIQVDNRREPERIPAMRSDWWNFGGLTRSVDLVRVPSTFMIDAWLTMAPDGQIVGGFELDGPDEHDVRLTIPALGFDEVVPSAFELDLEPERWAPGAPMLYDVGWSAADDQLATEVGFRTVSTDGTTLLVNGSPTVLRGISIHGEGPSGGRRSSGVDDAATLLGWAEDLNANFVRLAHYQHDEHMLAEADRRGLLAWCELPVYWGIAFDQPEVLAAAHAQLDELIRRDRSRCSTILWSVANETEPGPARNVFLADLIAAGRALDPTRLMTCALYTPPTSELLQQIDDPIADHVDVIAVNQYLGWYYGNREDMATTRWTSQAQKPIVFTELGAGAKAGRHGDPDEIWTEEFQAAVYDAQIEMFRNQSEVVGMSPWILKDFRAPLRVLPTIQDGYNRKGLVSEEGERKLAFDVLAEFYLELADPSP